MFKNYLGVALRGLLGNKLFSFINLFGLAVGLASAILIGLYVANELSYDRFQPDAERLFRLSRDYYAFSGPTELRLAALAPRVAPQLKADFPEIEEFARTMHSGVGLIAHGELEFYEEGIHFADPALFQLLHFDWVAGSPDTVFSTPQEMIITESIARKYFGAGEALGQTLKIENAADFTVTGVIRDLPDNTHFEGNIFFPLQSFLNLIGPDAANSWTNDSTYTYVKLKPGANIAALAAGFPAFFNRHIDAEASQRTGITAINVSDIHLHSSRQGEMGEPGSMAAVLSLGTVAFGIVLIACFNFMNLSTARSVLRGKEVGVRKTIGAERRQLILQFLGESIAMTFIATLVAIMFVELVLPAFNAFAGKALVFDVLRDTKLQLALALLVLGVGGMAGSYPALYLSAIKPAQVLKSRIRFGLKDVVFRNLLVVLQFSISIVLVIATAVVFLQMRFARNLDLGFDREQVLVLTGSPTQGLTSQWETLREELLRHPGVAAVTSSSTVPAMENPNGFNVKAESNPEARFISRMFVDYGFFETYGIELLAGRLFARDFPADRLPDISGGAIAGVTPDQVEALRQMTGNFILNESAARELGWTPESALDQPLRANSDDGRFGATGRVVGVVADSNFESLRFNVKPMIFVLSHPSLNATPIASVRITGNDLAGTLAYIDQTWKRVIPQFPVNRRFLSDSFEALYQDDTRLGQMFSSFAALAIVVACLGLFGLATFNAQRRTKEIGVRKVMGGTVWSIVWLLTSDFSRLVLVSNLIAWPAAYITMESWLQNFAYRIDLTPLIFIGSGLIALCIAWVTVGGTAAKAATQKPVLALRYE
jgi:putative ABC transport system permease protein